MRTVTLLPLLCFLAAALVIGCGGGGGGGGGTGGGGGNAPLPGQYIEFIAPGGANLDPLNLHVGDDAQVVVANYDPSGNRTLLNASNFATTDPGNVTISQTGHLHVNSRPPGVFGVSADATVAGVGKSFEQDAAVPASNTTVSGRVVEQVTGDPVMYVQVTVYDQSGTAVAGARTKFDGTFKARVPATAKTVSIKAATVQTPRYYHSFEFKTKVYTMDASTCPVKLGALKLNQDNPISAPFELFLQIDGPPPPPTGCQP